MIIDNRTGVLVMTLKLYVAYTLYFVYVSNGKQVAAQNVTLTNPNTTETSACLNGKLVTTVNGSKCECFLRYEGSKCNTLPPCDIACYLENGYIRKSDCLCICHNNGTGPACKNRNSTAPSLPCDYPDSHCYTSYIGCQFKGKQTSPELCRTLGNNGWDDDECNTTHSEAATVCDRCETDDMYKFRKCPVACGLCKVQVYPWTKAANESVLTLEFFSTTEKTPSEGNSSDFQRETMLVDVNLRMELWIGIVVGAFVLGVAVTVLIMCLVMSRQKSKAVEADLRYISENRTHNDEVRCSSLEKRVENDYRFDIHDDINEDTYPGATSDFTLHSQPTSLDIPRLTTDLVRESVYGNAAFINSPEEHEDIGFQDDDHEDHVYSNMPKNGHSPHVVEPHDLRHPKLPIELKVGPSSNRNSSC